MNTMNGMHEQTQFYIQGYKTEQIVPSQASDTVKTLMRDARDGKLKEGFSWHTKSKYPNARDLRPQANEYDEAILEFLFEQDIPMRLKKFTGRILYPALVKLRVNLPGPSYTRWHRDSDLYHDIPHRDFPPLINLHYYPTLGDGSESTIAIWPRTHLKMNRHQMMDHLYRYFNKPDEVMTDDDSYVVVDTSVIHEVRRTQYTHGSIRLMYSFCEEWQLDRFIDHVDFHQRYKVRFKEFYG